MKRTSGHVDIEFAEDYPLRHTHFQRVATEYRVPLFEGFTMPTCNKDSETASLYKQLLLRPLAVSPTEEPEDERMLKAFAPMSSVLESEVADKNRRGQTAFTRMWLSYFAGAGKQAVEAERRFLSRYEWPSLWETEEMQLELHSRKLEQACVGDVQDSRLREDSLDPPHCHDRIKPRATVEMYVSLVATQVAPNLEGIALARDGNLGSTNLMLRYSKHT